MENNYVQLTIENHVAIITLNRPEAGNSLDYQMAKQLMKAAVFCSENEKVRAVVLTGAGNKFSVGGDLKSFASHGDEVGAHLKIVTGYFHQAVSLFARMNKPIIAAVNGVAAGGGMSLACACDLVYSSENAKFVTAYNNIGLTPDGSGSYFLPRLIGMRRAFELLYTNRVLAANEAKEWGLVNDVLPSEKLKPFVIDLATKLANGPKNAYGVTKRLFLHSLQETLESQMSMESLLIAERASSAEGKEGISAFLEKREADYVKNSEKLFK
ncbi:enoyl-CoA hydratase/isomerase family protein [Bacillus marasmi]|uniref:enoyl-CoA hydratase/isomerase family protein n=1 Tax=Bacillus marasmi TaxID=1926279 RepID=UPI0011C7BD86|nr:enoyl-CoA hydratase-related protein [Bacillus marasmi]